MYIGAVKRLAPIIVGEKMYKNYISVFCFGCLGGLCRYLIGVNLAFIGTIIVNLIGCFALAFITYYMINTGLISGWLSAGLGTGFIGAFTTFSTFNLDLIKLIDNGQLTFALLYFVISSVCGLVAVLCGYLLAMKAGANR